MGLTAESTGVGIQFEIQSEMGEMTLRIAEALAAARKAGAAELQVALEDARSQAATERLSSLRAAEAAAEEARRVAVEEAKREAANELAAVRAAAAEEKVKA